MVQKLSYGIGWDRATEIIALNLIATSSFKMDQLIEKLHALCDDPHMQVMGQCDDGGDDSCIIRAVAYIADETAVDFQTADRQAPDMGKIGKAFTEIIQRNGYAERFEIAQYLAGGFDGFDKAVLGDFDLQTAGVQLVVR